jgi:superfamily I DNA/RNA helicase
VEFSRPSSSADSRRVCFLIRVRGRRAELEEERRLCYVGLTRAERLIVLTSAARRRVFGDYQSTVPSRFLDEFLQS